MIVGDKPYKFETRVFEVVCVVAAARALFAVMAQAGDGLNSVVLLTNAGFAIIYLSFLILHRYFKKLSSLVVPLCVVSVVLFLGNWWLNEGIYGSAEYNIMGGIVMLGLLLDFKYRVAFISIIILAVALSLWFDPWDRPLTDTGAIDYLLTSAAIGIVILLFKHNFDKERHLLTQKKQELEDKINLEKQVNAELTREKSKLDYVNLILEESIRERVADLEQKNHAIEQYIRINTRDLKIPIKLLGDMVSGMEPEGKEQEQLFNMLIQSADELQSVNDQINLALKSGGINRKYISST